VRAVVAKMALDQLFWTPIALVLFFSCFALLEGRSLAALRAQLRAKFLPTLVKGFALWPAAHLINFRYIPNQMRILYVNMVQARRLSD
jgi:protein Mpv17